MTEQEIAALMTEIANEEEMMQPGLFDQLLVCIWFEVSWLMLIAELDDDVVDTPQGRRDFAETEIHTACTPQQMGWIDSKGRP